MIPGYGCFNYGSSYPLTLKRPMTASTICKIVSREDRDLAIRDGHYRGSPHDLSDGFLHFSTEEQVAGTLEKHYGDVLELWLLRVDVNSLGHDLKWETSRDGKWFPHLYAPLPLSSVQSIQPIRMDRSGALYPKSIQRRVLYLHGWNSVVGGLKPSSLQAVGHTIIEPVLDSDDFDSALRVAQKAFEDYQPELVIGSSRGGALVINLQLPDATSRILLCPAWRKWGKITRVPVNTLVLHSPSDDVIPFADSQTLIETSGLSGSHLQRIGSDHRLATPEAIKALGDACLEFPDRTFPPFHPARLGSDTGVNPDLPGVTCR